MSTSTRSAAAAASAAAARSRCPRASTRSTGSSSAASHLTPVAEVERAIRGRPRARRRPPPRLHRLRRRRRRHRRAAREPALPPGRAQGGRRAPDRDRPGRAPLLRRGRSVPSSGSRPATCDALREALAARVGARRARRRPGVSSPSCSARCSTGAGAITVAVHDGSTITGVWPGLPRPRVRDRVRHRLDDRRRPPLRPAHRRGARVRRRDEPADPLRRGSDEPRLVRDAEPRLGEGADAGSFAAVSRSSPPSSRPQPRSTATTSSRSRSSATRSCTTSCSGSIRRRSAARPSRSTIDEAVRLPARELGLPVHRGARAYVLPCIAGHVGADTAGVILSEGPHLGDEVNLIVDVGTNAEIVLGNRERLLAASSPTGPAFEGAQISLRAARRAGRDRARAHRPGDARAAHPRDRLRRLVGRARVRGHAGHGRLRLGDHRGDRGAPSRRRAHDRRDDRRRAREPLAAHRRRRAHLLVRSLGRRARARHHAERRPADPAGQGGPLRGLRAADGALRDRDGRPHPARGSVRDAHRPRSRARARARSRLRPRSGHRRGQRRGHGCADRAPQPRRASRDRGGRAPRREGRDRRRAALPGALRATRWRSRTTSTRTRGWRATVRLPGAPDRIERDGRRERRRRERKPA